MVTDRRQVAHAWDEVLPYPPDLGPHPTGPKRRRRAYGPCGRQAGGGRGEALLKAAEHTWAKSLSRKLRTLLSFFWIF